MSQLHDKNSPISVAPAFVIFLVLCSSLFFYGRGYSFVISLLTSLLIAASWMLIGSKKLTKDRLSVFILILLISTLFSVYSMSSINKKINMPPTVETKGKILTNRKWGKMRAVLIRTKYGKFVAYLHKEKAPKEGTTVDVRGALFDFDEESHSKNKKNNFNEKAYWYSKKVKKKIIVLEMTEISSPQGIYRWRNHLREVIEEKLPPNLSAYMLALTVGEKDKDLSEIHKKVGTSHLLAVSGFHIGLISLIFLCFFRKGKIKFFGISAVIWSVVWLAGVPPGAVRAALMLQIYLLGVLLGKPVDAFNSVSVAGIIMLLFNPWIFYDIGWRLSISATLFLSAFASTIRFKKLKTTTSIVISTLVWFVTAPFVVYAFYEAPVVGILANIVAIPVFTVLFPIILIISFLLFLNFPFSNIFVIALEYLLESWNVFSNFLSQLFPWTVFATPSLKSMSIFLLMISAGFASGVSFKKSTFIALLFAITIIFLF